MSKKIVSAICAVFAAIILCGIAALGAHFIERNNDFEWPYEVKIGMRSEITWDINEELPVCLPVYKIEKSADTSRIWKNIIAFCGFEDDILFTYNVSFSNEDWQIRVDEDGRIVCLYNAEIINTEYVSTVSVDYPEPEELAWSFLEGLGVRTENYCISCYSFEPEQKTRILDFSYKLGEYKSGELPAIISIGFVDDMMTELQIRFEDIAECGSVSAISTKEIKKQLRDMSFYTTSRELAKMNSLKKLNISGIDIAYVRENNMLVPYLSLHGECSGPVSGDVTSSRIKAYDGATIRDTAHEK